jgi:hypothetical protein
MKKGKSRMRARKNLLRSSEASARKRARKLHYDRRQYDKPVSEES